MGVRFSSAIMLTLSVGAFSCSQGPGKRTSSRGSSLSGGDTKIGVKMNAGREAALLEKESAVYTIKSADVKCVDGVGGSQTFSAVQFTAEAASVAAACAGGILLNNVKFDISGGVGTSPHTLVTLTSSATSPASRLIYNASFSLDESQFISNYKARNAEGQIDVEFSQRKKRDVATNGTGGGGGNESTGVGASAQSSAPFKLISAELVAADSSVDLKVKCLDGGSTPSSMADAQCAGRYAFPSAPTEEDADVFASIAALAYDFNADPDKREECAVQMALDSEVTIKTGSGCATMSPIKFKIATSSVQYNSADKTFTFVMNVKGLDNASISGALAIFDGGTAVVMPWNRTVVP